MYRPSFPEAPTMQTFIARLRESPGPHKPFPRPMSERWRLVDLPSTRAPGLALSCDLAKEDDDVALLSLLEEDLGPEAFLNHPRLRPLDGPLPRSRKAQTAQDDLHAVLREERAAGHA